METYSAAHNFKDFIIQQSIFNRIVIQGIIQIFILSVVFFILRYSITTAGQAKAITKHLPLLLCLILALDLIAAAQLNAPYTSYMQSSGTAAAQKMIHASPEGFPPPSESLLNQKSHSQGIFKPFDFNINVLHKDIVPDGCCSFGLSSYFSFIQSSPEERERVLNHPWYYAENVEITSSEKAVKLSSFSPGEFVFESNSDTSIRLVVMQNNYPDWSATINDQAQKIQLHEGSFMALDVPSGNNHITLRYKPVLIEVLFWISLFTFIIICLLAGVLQLRIRCTENQTTNNSPR
jgi:hypothetical protein